MKAYTQLPPEYAPCLTIDLQRNKKQMLLVNGLALVIALVMLFGMHQFVPITHFFDGGEDAGPYFLRTGLFVVMVIAYLFLHEGIHGVAMKLCGTQKVKYGFTGLYAFAGSEDYYDKWGYLFIALAPVVVFLVVFAIATALVPLYWFWTIYFLQVLNVSGAAGDLYVTARMLRLPRDILVRDSGVSMTVYSKQ